MVKVGNNNPELRDDIAPVLRRIQKKANREMREFLMEMDFKVDYADIAKKVVDLMKHRELRKVVKNGAHLSTAQPSTFFNPLAEVLGIERVKELILDANELI